MQFSHAIVRPPASTYADGITSSGLGPPDLALALEQHEAYCRTLDRLGLSHEIGLRFPPEELLPEAGQGALALQVRAGEEELVGVADHLETRRRVEAERACVFAIGGGCLAPVAAFHDGATLTALVAAEDGSWVERRSGDDPSVLATELAAFSPA